MAVAALDKPLSSLEYRCRFAFSHLFSLLMFNTLLTTRGSRESSEMSSELSSTQDGVSISVATISGLNSQCTSWAHNGSREPSETSSELSAQDGVSSTSVATTSGLNSPTATAGGVEEAAAENDDVKVIVCLVDATDRMLTKYALNFAITECASRGDTIFLLGLLQGIPAVRTTGRTHPPPLLDSNLQQLISDTRRVYEAKLGNFLSQAQKRAIKLEVKIGVGPAINEIIALGATWVILDSDMGIHRQKILEKTNCGLVEMTTDHSRKFTRIYNPSLRIRSQTPQQHLFSPTSCCFSRFCR
ncbi:unnamed protein product [Sphagnum troendelagicum]|uniref:Universal stress protein n=1 Tax=Sphagnum troendelagicum TaxID=128251 RepID=A0ABP0UA97_9BRYO